MLTPDAKDSCLGYKKPFQAFSEADQVLFVFFGFSVFSDRLFQNLPEIRWLVKSFLNIKCTRSHMVTLCHSKGNRRPLPTTYLYLCCSPIQLCRQRLQPFPPTRTPRSPRCQGHWRGTLPSPKPEPCPNPAQTQTQTRPKRTQKPRTACSAEAAFATHSGRRWALLGK